MKTTNIILTAALLAGTCFPVLADQELHLEWVEKDGKQYWYENGEIQGKEGDDKNITDEIYGIERGREIYDPSSDAWYWLDANAGGAKAVNKEVWVPYVYQDETPGSTEGKWVRYDEEGKMIKGWYIDGQKVYYFDLVTGAMAKGKTDFRDGSMCFDWLTGTLLCSEQKSIILFQEIGKTKVITEAVKGMDQYTHSNVIGSLNEFDAVRPEGNYVNYYQLKKEDWPDDTDYHTAVLVGLDKADVFSLHDKTYAYRVEEGKLVSGSIIVQDNQLLLLRSYQEPVYDSVYGWYENVICYNYLN